MWRSIYLHIFIHLFRSLDQNRESTQKACAMLILDGICGHRRQLTLILPIQRAKAKNSKSNIQLPAGIMHFRLPTYPKPCPIWLFGEGEACTRTLGQRQVASSGACRAQIFGELWAAIYLWRRGQTNANKYLHGCVRLWLSLSCCCCSCCSPGQAISLKRRLIWLLMRTISS